MASVTAHTVEAAFRQFICRACGYIYDEALGDPDGGLAPGTRFEDIPDDWMCPTCGVGKYDFEPYVVVRTPAAGPIASPIIIRDRQLAKRLPIVIVGGGIAGWAVAKALRAMETDDAARPVVMISGCNACVYPKPLISVALAQGRTATSLISENGDAAAQRLNVRLMRETWVSGIDSPRHRVRTTRGAIAYSQLVLALGAAPVQLPLDAESNRHLWRINHLDHYARFRAAVGDAPRHVAIVGAGLVGCELADDLAGVGHRVTLIDMAAQPLPGLATAAAAQALTQSLTAAGVRFVGMARLRSVRKTSTGVDLDLGNEMVHADLALAATGLRTDARLARSAHLTFNNGFAVDPLTLRTSDPAIYALGDCASFSGKAYRFIEPIHRQAEVIAAALLDRPSPGFALRDIPVRLKSRSMPMTFSSAA